MIVTMIMKIEEDSDGDDIVMMKRMMRTVRVDLSTVGGTHSGLSLIHI